MTALPVALMYIKMAQVQLGLPLTAPEKPEVFYSDPLTNLKHAMSLIQWEIDALECTRA